MAGLVRPSGPTGSVLASRAPRDAARRRATPSGAPIAALRS
jgi:hypothetical protein